jgi:integrase
MSVVACSCSGPHPWARADTREAIRLPRLSDDAGAAVAVVPLGNRSSSRRSVEACGRKWVTPHTLREDMATLISKRVDPATASQQLSHSSPALTWEFHVSKSTKAADVAHVLDELAEADPERAANTPGICGG